MTIFYQSENIWSIDIYRTSCGCLVCFLYRSNGDKKIRCPFPVHDTLVCDLPVVAPSNGSPGDPFEKQQESSSCNTTNQKSRRRNAPRAYRPRANQTIRRLARQCAWIDRIASSVSREWNRSNPDMVVWGHASMEARACH